MLDKPFGIRIHKATQKVVYVDPSGSSANLVAVGDIIISIDNMEIRDYDTLQKIMREPTPRVFVKFRRNAYSHSRRTRSTVDTLIMKRETKLLRAINLYIVCIHVTDKVSTDDSDLLGLSVSYDARERLQIASTKRSSLAAIHLHPMDVIKEVNGHPVASKSMLRYWLLESIEKNGFVEFLIQGEIDQNNVYDYELEMPEDVLAITEKQIKVQHTMTPEHLHGIKTILRKGLPQSKEQLPLTISDNIVEFPIESDFDPKKLQKVKRARTAGKI